MTSRLEGRATAWRVTGVTVTDTTGIVSPGAASEGRSGMTGGTIQTGCNVCGDGIHLASRRITIMAGSTVVHDAGMVEGRRDETLRIVANTAILIGFNMIA